MIIRIFTVIHGAEDFWNICNLSLVCKQFHQFIKNQLIPNERFLFFVQAKDLIVDEYTKKYKVKGIINAPFKKLMIIFPYRFLIQEYSFINFMGSFPKIEELGLLMNFSLDFSSKSIYGETNLEFGEKIDNSKLMITIDYSYSQHGEYDRYKKFYDKQLIHTTMIDTRAAGEKRNLFLNPCLCFEEFPPDIRELYGYKGWTSGTLSLIKKSYEFLETNFLSQLENPASNRAEYIALIQTSYKEFEIFSQKKEKLIFNTLNPKEMK